MQYYLSIKMLETFEKHRFKAIHEADFYMMPFFSLCVLNIHRRILLFCSITLSFIFVRQIVDVPS